METSIIAAEDKFAYLTELLKPFFSKIVVAIIVLLIGFIIGKFTQRIIQKILDELALNEISKRLFNKHIRIEEMISSLFGVAVYVVTVITVLEILGLSALIIKILTIGVLVLIVLMVVLTVKDFLPNLFASFILHKKGHVNKGTALVIDGVAGVVSDMSWSDVQIMTTTNDVIHIPNILFVKKEFKTTVQNNKCA